MKEKNYKWEKPPWTPRISKIPGFNMFFGSLDGKKKWAVFLQKVGRL